MSNTRHSRPGRLALLALLGIAALAACAPAATEREHFTRSRAIAEEAESSGRMCAQALPGLVDARPMVAWSALELHPGAAEPRALERDRVARWDRGELRRRVARLEALSRAMTSLAQRPQQQSSMDLVGLAEESRGLARGLCRVRDALAAAAEPSHGARADSTPPPRQGRQ